MSYPIVYFAEERRKLSDEIHVQLANQLNKTTHVAMQLNNTGWLIRRVSTTICSIRNSFIEMLFDRYGVDLASWTSV